MHADVHHLYHDCCDPENRILDVVPLICYRDVALDNLGAHCDLVVGFGDDEEGHSADSEGRAGYGKVADADDSDLVAVGMLGAGARCGCGGTANFGSVPLVRFGGVVVDPLVAYPTPRHFVGVARCNAGSKMGFAECSCVLEQVPSPPMHGCPVDTSPPHAQYDAQGLARMN